MGTQQATRHVTKLPPMITQCDFKLSNHERKYLKEAQRQTFPNLGTYVIDTPRDDRLTLRQECLRFQQANRGVLRNRAVSEPDTHKRCEMRSIPIVQLKEMYDTDTRTSSHRTNNESSNKQASMSKPPHDTATSKNYKQSTLVTGQRTKPDQHHVTDQSRVTDQHHVTSSCGCVRWSPTQQGLTPLAKERVSVESRRSHQFQSCTFLAHQTIARQILPAVRRHRGPDIHCQPADREAESHCQPADKTNQYKDSLDYAGNKRLLSNQSILRDRSIEINRSWSISEEMEKQRLRPSVGDRVPQSNVGHTSKYVTWASDLRLGDILRRSRSKLKSSHDVNTWPHVEVTGSRSGGCSEDDIDDDSGLGWMTSVDVAVVDSGHYDLYANARLY